MGEKTSAPSAQLVADGVGLPPAWRCRSALVPGCGGPVLRSGRIDCDVAWVGPETIQPWELEHRVPTGTLLVDLSDEQTAFGCARRFDEWRRAIGHRPRWTLAVADWLLFDDDGAMYRAGIERLRTDLLIIGRDHQTRRTLDWVVGPGTLATLERYNEEDWVLRGPHGEHRTFTLPGIINPPEAHEAIWRMVREAAGGA